MWIGNKRIRKILELSHKSIAHVLSGRPPPVGRGPLHLDSKISTEHVETNHPVRKKGNKNRLLQHFHSFGRFLVAALYIYNATALFSALAFTIVPSDGICYLVATSWSSARPGSEKRRDDEQEGMKRGMPVLSGIPAGSDRNRTRRRGSGTPCWCFVIPHYKWSFDARR